MKVTTVRVLAWGAFALSVLFGVISVAITATNATAQPTHDSIQTGTVGTAVFATLILSFSIVGALIVTRRPDNGLGWLFCVDGVLMSFQNLASAYEFHGLTSNPGSLPGAVWFGLFADALWVPFIFMTTLLLFLLFPEGYPAGVGRRRAVVIATVGVAIATIVGGFLEPTLYSYPGIQNPIGVRLSDATYGLVTAGSFIALLGVLAYAVVDLFLRLRRSTGEERLQFRWFRYSTILILLVFLPSTFFAQVPIVFQVIGELAIFTLPIAVGFAVLRYRLYDIDVVVKKTIVYGILAGLIVVVGGLMILVLGGIVVGPISDHAGLLVVAGAVMGASIWPLYRVASRLADRIVFKGRETPYEVLTSFADRVAETYSTDDVLPRMAQVLAAGTGAESATVWLRSDDAFRAAAVWPMDAPAPTAIPIGATEVRHQGEVLGALSAEMPANDPMNPSKEALIRDLASQAGLVLRNVRLIEDLRGSRRRIVAAQDERARKLERNIHDGAQQQLVALQVKVRLADAAIDRDPAKAHELLDQLQREANDALENLRDLARGIYPPLLADKGLPTALEAQARKSPLPVDVVGDGTGRYTPEIESAVYFSCLEALQNVAKYAGASRVTVRLGLSDGVLSFEVRDDGVGFEPASADYGTGLQGIADRLAALGGELIVTSAPRDGTAVAGRLPVGGPS